jgi:hypothetical protein
MDGVRARQMDHTDWDMVLWTSIVFRRSHHRDHAIERARKALSNGANASMIDPNGTMLTALCAAVNFSCIEMVNLLLFAGANAAGTATQRELFICATNTGGPNTDKAAVLHSLFTKGFLETVTIDDIIMAMHDLSMNGTLSGLDIMRVCIYQAVARGHDLSQLLAHTQSDDRTMLHNAAVSLVPETRAPLVCLLIEYGANVLMRDRHGNTPEDLARLNGTAPHVVAILVEQRLRIANCAAFAMGHHTRLGGISMMYSIDPAVLREICERVLNSDDIRTIAQESLRGKINIQGTCCGGIKEPGDQQH